MSFSLKFGTSKLCPCCKKYSTAFQRHHKFSQTKWARKLYGDLLDDPKNILNVCAGCNTSHSHPDLIHWGELEFCQALGIQPRSKLNKNKS